MRSRQMVGNILILETAFLWSFLDCNQNGNVSRNDCDSGNISGRNADSPRV